MTRNDWRQLFRQQAEPWPQAVPPPENKGEIGEEARKLLDNPVLQLAMARIEQRLVNTWKNTETGDDERREATYACLWGLKEFRAELGRMIAEAGMAQRKEGRG